MDINNIIKGHKKFKDIHFPSLKGTFGTLVENGQNPEILFIGCSDSRVLPELIVDSKPGDMFILRNIGNFVPPYKNDIEFHGSSAVIEYAVSILNVKDIIICGHSHCGACASLYKDFSKDKNLTHVSKWLELGKRAKEHTMSLDIDKNDTQAIYTTTEKISIKHQLENLITYPEVASRIKNKTLDIHGWYYKIEDGSIEYYDGESGDFKTLGDQEN